MSNTFQNHARIGLLASMIWFFCGCTDPDKPREIIPSLSAWFEQPEHPMLGTNSYLCRWTSESADSGRKFYVEDTKENWTYITNLLFGIYGVADAHEDRGTPNEWLFFRRGTIPSGAFIRRNTEYVYAGKNTFELIVD